MASSFVDEQSWSPQDWKWDSYNLKAEPNDAPPAKGSGGKAARATAADGAKQGCQVRAAVAALAPPPPSSCAHHPMDFSKP